MKAEQLVSLIRERGLAVVMGEDGVPRLRGDSRLVTPGLLACVRRKREEILALLRPPVVAVAPLPDVATTGPAREWLWRTGHQSREYATDARHGDQSHHPAGAWWWRWQGETEWRPVPGRNPEGVAACA